MTGSLYITFELWNEAAVACLGTTTFNDWNNKGLKKFADILARQAFSVKCFGFVIENVLTLPKREQFS